MYEIWQQKYVSAYEFSKEIAEQEEVYGCVTFIKAYLDKGIVNAVVSYDHKYNQFNSHVYNMKFKGKCLGCVCMGECSRSCFEEEEDVEEEAEVGE